MNNSILVEYKNKTKQKLICLENLKNIVIHSNIYLEGNCFYHHLSFTEYPELYAKQLNLFWCGKLAVNNICEIGFNAGHSAMLMLLGKNNTPLHFTIFELGHHAYSRPCFEYIQSTFSHVQFEYIEGDSVLTMHEWINNHPEFIHTYCVVHVDGGHAENCILNDMKHADLLVKKNGIIIVDDTNSYWINKYVDLYISNGNYIELPMFPTVGYPHRIIKKMK